MTADPSTETWRAAVNDERGRRDPLIDRYEAVCRDLLATEKRVADLVLALAVAQQAGPCSATQRTLLGDGLLWCELRHGHTGDHESGPSRWKDAPTLEQAVIGALDQIRLLHTDSPVGVCPTCFRPADVSDTDDGLVGYPCPTVRAIGSVVDLTDLDRIAGRFRPGGEC